MSRDWISNLKENSRGLAIVLTTWWLGSAVLHATGEYWTSTFAHGEVPWLVDFYRTTFENWQSEFLQVLAFAWLTKHLILQGSPQSKDGDERLEAKIDDLYDLTESIRHRIWEYDQTPDEPV